MGLRTVTNIGDPLVNPSNVVAPFTKVTFRLKNLDIPDGLIFNIDTNDVVEGVVRTLTDANGEFSVQLYPTSELSPNTTYVVTIQGWGTFTAGLEDGISTKYLIDWFTNGVPLTGGELSALQTHMVDTAVHLTIEEKQMLSSLGVTTIISPGSLGGNRLVMGDGNYADNTDLNTVAKVIGFTKTSAILGELVTIITSGELNGFTGLTVNMPVYVSTNGNYTQVIPISGYIQRVGIPINSTTILVNLSEPLIKV